MAISSKVAVNVANRSGFDKSFRNLLTAKCGSLVPVLVDEVIPGTRVHLKSLVSGSLAPLASETFMNVQYRLEAFFVPYRLLYGGFEDWICQNPLVSSASTGNTSVPKLPYLTLQSFKDTTGGTLPNPDVAAGSLADYLGYYRNDAQNVGFNANYFLFASYHKIYNDWYRNSRIQKDIYTKYSNTVYDSSLNSVTPCVATLPYQAFTSINTIGGWILDSSTGSYVRSPRCLFADGVSLFDLRQRNFDDDYFTLATPDPQQGSAQGVSFTTSGSTGSFTISQLRAANSLQQFLERNNLAGNRYVDYVKAHYGADLSDGVAQRSLYLGRTRMDIYSKGVFQTVDSNGSTSTNTPFDSVASRYGSPYFAGNDILIDDFTANEYGCIMVLGSIVPKVSYTTGCSRQMISHYVDDASRVQIAEPLLQNTGNQPIYTYELTGLSSSVAPVFGYIDRYAEWMTKNDECHGIIKDGETLQSFALQRSFPYGAGIPVISSEFIQIPTNFMDQVSAVGTEVSDYGAWIDHFFDYKVSMPLAEFSMPSLQDPAYEHGHKVVIDRNGKHV